MLPLSMAQERAALLFIAALALIAGYTGLLTTAEPGVKLVETCFGVLAALGFALAAMALWPR